MKKYTANWKPEHRPKWSIRSGRIPTGYQSRMSTKDQPFVWVEAGTKKRYRVMSPGWQSKTRKGSLSTRSGRGKALGFSKTPRPGIEARDNLDTLAKIRAPIFAVDMQKRMNAGATQVFSGKSRPG